MPVGRVQRDDVVEILRRHEERITRDAERFLADPLAWIYVGSGAPAPPFENGFFNVGGSRVPLRYRFLREWDPNLNPDTANPLAIQVQGSVSGGATGLSICTLKYPRYMPDGTPAWVTAVRDYDVHLTCHDDSGTLIVVTIQGSTGKLIQGFV
jgi:hypothetical protein